MERLVPCVKLSEPVNFLQSLMRTDFRNGGGVSSGVSGGPRQLRKLSSAESGIGKASGCMWEAFPSWLWFSHMGSLEDC